MDQVDRLLVVGTNWIGDSIMALPALQSFLAVRPARSIQVLCRPGLASFWDCAEAVSGVIPYTVDRRGMAEAAETAGRGGFDAVAVLPNSFRTARLAAMTGLGLRTGLRRPLGRFFLNRQVRSGRSSARMHQQYEYHHVLGLDAGAELPLPRLCVPLEAEAAAEARLDGLPRPFWSLVPGAARGASKRWPSGHFAALAADLLSARGGTVLLLGTEDDRRTCLEVASGVQNGRVENLAGAFSLREWLAVLALSEGVAANDSGGMHAAAALGVPCIGIFGLTNPRVTGPLGPYAGYVSSGGTGTRDIPRESAAAAKVLEGIRPEVVFKALQERVAARREGSRPDA